MTKSSPQTQNTLVVRNAHAAKHFNADILRQGAPCAQLAEDSHHEPGTTVPCTYMLHGTPQGQLHRHWAGQLHRHCSLPMPSTLKVTQSPMSIIQNVAFRGWQYICQGVFYRTFYFNLFG